MMYQAASSTESRISDPEHAQPLSESLKKIREKLFKYTKRNQFEDFEEIFTRYISTEQNKAYEKEIKEDLLMTACKYDRVQFVDFLLEDKELSPNGLPDERSPLQIATTKQHHQIIASLLAHPRIEVNRKDYGDDTALHDACATGNLDALKMFLSRKEIEINCEDTYGHTPLYYACLFAHPELVKLLLNQPGIRLEGMATAIFEAFEKTASRYPHHGSQHRQNILEIIETIFANKEIIEHAELNPQAIFQFACKHKVPGVVNFMLNNTDVSVDHVFSKRTEELEDIFNTSALQSVLESSPKFLCRHAMEVIEILLSRKVDINKTNGDGHSALFTACKKAVLFDEKNATKNKLTKTPFIKVVIKILNHPNIDLRSQGKNLPAILNFLNEKISAENTPLSIVASAKKIMTQLFIKGYIPSEDKKAEYDLFREITYFEFIENFFNNWRMADFNKRGQYFVTLSELYFKEQSNELPMPVIFIDNDILDRWIASEEHCPRFEAYKINRIFLHALCYPTKQWSFGFCQMLRDTKRLAKETFLNESSLNPNRDDKPQTDSVNILNQIDGRINAFYGLKNQAASSSQSSSKDEVIITPHLITPQNSATVIKYLLSVSDVSEATLQQIVSSSGFDPDANPLEHDSDYESSLLMLVAEKGNIPVASALVKAGAYIAKFCYLKKFHTILTYAVSLKQLEFTRGLLSIIPEDSRFELIKHNLGGWENVLHFSAPYPEFLSIILESISLEQRLTLLKTDHVMLIDTPLFNAIPYPESLRAILESLPEHRRLEAVLLEKINHHSTVWAKAVSKKNYEAIWVMLNVLPENDRQKILNMNDKHGFSLRDRAAIDPKLNDILNEYTNQEDIQQASSSSHSENAQRFFSKPKGFMIQIEGEQEFFLDGDEPVEHQQPKK